MVIMYLNLQQGSMLLKAAKDAIEEIANLTGLAFAEVQKLQESV